VRLVGRLGEERGSGLIELVAATAIIAVVLGATFGALSGFERSARTNEDQNDSQDRARQGISRLARELRNLASPTPTQPQALELAEPFDLVFQTVDPDGPNAGQNTSNVRRVRYCLDATETKNAKVWLQTQTWTSAAAPAMPSTSSCPSVAWGEKDLVAYGIMNKDNNRNQAVFTYDDDELADISSIGASLYVDANPSSEPAETRIRTSIFLRNQNRRPSAAFTATVVGSRHVLLNGWAAQDPEGQVLQYVWYAGGEQIGTGIELDWEAPSTGTYSFELKVVDPAGLDDTADPKAVTVS
jgi:type II secretory pathway pseudopilin PulG